MGLLGRRKKELSAKEQIGLSARKQLELSEVLAPDLVDESISIDFLILQDEMILGLFDKESPFYRPWLRAISPNFSRHVPLSNMNDKEARIFVKNVERILYRLKYRRKSPEDKALCLSLSNYIHARATAAIGGWLLNNVTERKKTVRLEEIALKKKGFFG